MENLVYLQQSSGLRPFTSGKNSGITDDFVLPEPQSVKAFRFIETELGRKGSKLNHFYDGVIIAVDSHHDSLASPIAEEAVAAGFERISLTQALPEEVASALHAAGFRTEIDWVEVLWLRKKSSF